MSWSNTVPELVDGVTQLDAASLNSIITSLRDRTEYLYSTINALTSGNALITRTSSIGAACAEGMLVYNDPLTRLWQPAAAAWGDISESDGSQRPAASAYPEALILDIDVNHYATLLLQGVCSDSAIVTTVTGGTARPGMYFLNDSGSCSMTSSPLAVACVKVVSGGMLIFTPARPDSRGHSHFRKQLTYGWTDAGAFPGTMEIPAGAVYGYNIGVDSSTASLLPLICSSASLVIDGAELNPAALVVNQDNIWLLEDWIDTSSSSFVLHGVTPFFGTEPVIRSARINPANSFLSAEMNQTTLTLDMNLPAMVADTVNGYTGLGVTGFDAQKRPVIGSVVQHITAGPGISIVAGALPGFKTIGASAILGGDLEASIVNLDSSLQLTGAGSIFLQFPAGIVSGATGICHLPGFADNTVNMTPVIVYRGNGGTIAAAAITLSEQPIPAGDGVDALVTTSEAYTIASISDTDASVIYRRTGSAAVAATGGSRVSINVSFDSPSTAVTVLYFGLILTLK